MKSFKRTLIAGCIGAITGITLGMLASIKTDKSVHALKDDDLETMNHHIAEGDDMTATIAQKKDRISKTLQKSSKRILKQIDNTSKKINQELIKQ